MLKVKRVYEEPSESDGYRVLVDRLWPRGLKKERAEVDLWLKEIAPSDSLRKWYGHDPDRWREFKKRYFEELKDKRRLLEHIEKHKGTVTLLFGSKEPRLNNAEALRIYIEERKTKT
jgi:uncharacterized protein YeaO (DUF488 family)